MTNVGHLGTCTSRSALDATLKWPVLKGLISSFLRSRVIMGYQAVRQSNPHVLDGLPYASMLQSHDFGFHQSNQASTAHLSQKEAHCSISLRCEASF